MTWLRLKACWHQDLASVTTCVATSPCCLTVAQVTLSAAQPKLPASGYCQRHPADQIQWLSRKDPMAPQARSSPQAQVAELFSTQLSASLLSIPILWEGCFLWAEHVKESLLFFFSHFQLFFQS